LSRSSNRSKCFFLISGWRKCVQSLRLRNGSVAPTKKHSPQSGTGKNYSLKGGKLTSFDLSQIFIVAKNDNFFLKVQMNHYKDACKAEDFKDCDNIYKVKKIEDKRFANRFGKKLLKRVKKVLQILQLHN
jgi:hypothetical protein